MNDYDVPESVRKGLEKEGLVAVHNLFDDLRQIAIDTAERTHSELARQMKMPRGHEYEEVRTAAVEFFRIADTYFDSMLIDLELAEMFMALVETDTEVGVG